MKIISKHQISLYIAAAALLFSSCRVSKDAAIPDMHLPPVYAGNKAGLDTVSIGKVKWEDFFADSLLKKLLNKALAQNNEIQLALKNLDASRLLLIQVNLGNLPTLELQTASSINRPSENSLNGNNIRQALNATHIQDYNVNFNASWEADIWGKIRSQKASALNSYLQTEEAKKAVQTALVNQVSKGYYNLQMLDELLQIAKRNLALSERTLKIINLQFAAGQVTFLAVQQAEAQKLISAELIPQFEQRIIIQQNALNVLTGEMQSNISRSDNFTISELADSLSVGIPAELLSLRPDVKMYEFALNTANANVGIARAQMYPSLSITAIFGLDAFKASNWFNLPASIFATAAANVAQPIFNQKKLRTQYELAKNLRERSVINFKQSVLLAVSEVSDALAQLDKLKKQEAFETQRTRILMKATQNSELLFTNGMANYLEVVLAQSNVLQSELQLANIKKARLDAIVDLYRAVGGGWN